MWISFLTTNEELEEKEFKKKVVKNMYENRRINNEAREKIDTLMSRITEYKNLKNSLITEKERAYKFMSQIKFYEKELADIEGKIKDISEKASQKIKQVLTLEKDIRERRDNVVSLLNDLTKELGVKNNEVQSLTKELSAQLALIKKLMLKIDSMEEIIGIKE
jgi:chromosome segregation ATPase